jgi:predicted TIM-barrel fold metal-dependent hydrolase
MIKDWFVIDAVAHGFNWSTANRVPGPNARFADALVEANYGWYAGASLPEHALPKHQWIEEPWDADLLGRWFFEEGAIDACIYHEIPLWWGFKDGGSPLSVGRAMHERWPDRVAMYAGLNPYAPDAMDRIDQLIEEDGVIGFKLYPLDLVEMNVRPVRLDDDVHLFPLIDHMRKRGIRSVAVHKAVPYALVPQAPFRYDDIEGAAATFPDMFFEVVHGGVAFLEEMAIQLATFPNVAVNLEGTATYLRTAPKLFGRILAELLRAGGEDRIIWGTGNFVHPQPLLELFVDYKFPPEIVDGYGVPELTDDVKRKILAQNIMRVTGIEFASTVGAASKVDRS